MLHEAGRIDLRQPGRSDSGLPLRDDALIAVLRERPTAGTSAKPCRIRSRRKERSAAQHRRGPRAQQRTQPPRVFRVFGLRVSGVLRVEEVYSPLQSRSGGGTDHEVARFEAGDALLRPAPASHWIAARVARRR
ncbi:hypothetical protein ASG32_31095 [Methylobacterium sp. Leaf361]|nr:hypothetical protein ASG32_31095 [Methylobacterium sp. Leaf361]